MNWRSLDLRSRKNQGPLAFCVVKGNLLRPEAPGKTGNSTDKHQA